MKSKKVVISTVFLAVLLIAGASFAWFVSGPKAIANEFKMGTVIVKVVEDGFVDITNTTATTYNKNVQVESLGTKRTYVRVRLVPEWSDPSLPVSNVTLNLGSNSDWILHTDGYYYFKYYLTPEHPKTSKLLESVTFTDLGPEYDGEIFTLKVVAEGVQITHNAWQDVWGLTQLPFTAEQAWTN